MPQIPGSLRGSAPQRGSRGLAPWPKPREVESLGWYAWSIPNNGRLARPHGRQLRPLSPAFLLFPGGTLDIEGLFCSIRKTFGIVTMIKDVLPVERDGS